MRYTVRYETRQPGALGIFTPRMVTIDAPTPEDAAAIACDYLTRSRGLETRSPLEVTTNPDGFTCSQCGTFHHYPHAKTGVSGYARTIDGVIICYDCCAVNDRAEMEKTGRATLYIFERDGKTEVINWPGTLRFAANMVTHSARGGGFGSQRTDVWFTGPNGEKWYGVNRGNNDLVRCRRMRGVKK